MHPCTGTAHPAPQAPARHPHAPAKGPYSICYAVSISDDPLGAYYRYEFLRPLFPDYPRPAIWPDGYYVPSSTGDEVIEKHACVVERSAMIAGRPAREQCFVINDVNFLNNADLDGTQLPPRGAPNVMMAAGGTQLKKVFEDDAILTWKMFTNWADASKSRLEGPSGSRSRRITTSATDSSPTACRSPAPNAGSMRKATRSWRGSSIAASATSNRSSACIRSTPRRAAAACAGMSSESMASSNVKLISKAPTRLAPGHLFRWMASPAMDKAGNIGIGYSFGDATNFAGQRFAARRAGDPLGQLTLARSGAGRRAKRRKPRPCAGRTTRRRPSIPSDDCTIWYVGDYVKKDASSYSTRIGAFRIPGCTP